MSMGSEGRTSRSTSSGSLDRLISTSTLSYEACFVAWRALDLLDLYDLTSSRSTVAVEVIRSALEG